MRWISIAWLACLWSALAPASVNAQDDPRIERFDAELRDLAATLDIPGVAYVIVEDGKVVADGAFGEQRDGATAFATDTPLRIASVTKALTAVAALQIVEEGRLDLDAPASRYVPSIALPPAVTVRHLLTHTSEGTPGEQFVYGTTRFSRLGPILAAADGRPFEDVLRKRIAEKAGMRWHESEGLGAHAAFVSTVDEMGKFVVALDNGALIGGESLSRLATPSRSIAGAALPVSLGWFAQEVQGLPVIWSFGQDDPEHSGALLLRLPKRKLTLFLLANGNAVSDPFRLLSGDVRKSPFAMSFLRIFAFAAAAQPLPPIPKSEALASWLDEQEGAVSYVYADELAGRALVEAWRGETGKAQEILQLVVARYPAPPDAVFHFAAMQFDMEALRQDAIAWGNRLVSEQPSNRWVRLAQGYLLQRSGDANGAIAQFQANLALPNQEPDFLHLLFQNWSWLALAELHRERDPAVAREYLLQALGSGITGPTLDSARQALANLDE